MKYLRVALLILPLLGCNEDAPPDFQGYIEGEYLRIAAPEAGWLQQVAVTKGQSVAAGAALFTLDHVREEAMLAEARSKWSQAQSDLADLRLGSRDEEIAAIEAQLADAEATATLANLTLERNARLVASQTVSQSQMDAARATAQQAAAGVARIRAQLATARLAARPNRIAAAQSAVEAARHAVEQAQWQRDQRDLASPAAAMVDDVIRRPGEFVPGNGVVVSLLPPGGIKAVFFVPEARRSTIRPDATMLVSCTGCPQGLTATISRMANSAEFTPPVIYSQETRAKLVFRVEAILAPGANLPMPGQPVSVRTKP